MGMYDQLGVVPVINAAAALTKLGGSLMPPPVVAAMTEAATSFVDLPELHDRIGERLAELTRNEAACVSSGAAGGILLAVAACLVGTSPAGVAALPDLDGVARTEIVAYRSQRNGFLSGARQTGARLVEIGPSPEELDAAITERTAGVIWFAASLFAEGALPLADVVRIAHARNVPVIVDAADQIPPVANLWHYTAELGADLAIFSGGKGLRGPQTSGLLLGRRDLIAACRANSGPYHSLGRPAKVGKEEMTALLAAVEWSLAQDEATVCAGYDATVRRWQAGLAHLPGVTTELDPASHTGQPIARAIVRVAPPCPLSRDQIVTALWDQSPRVAVLPVGDDALALNPQMLEPGQDELVLAALRRVLAYAVPAR